MRFFLTGALVVCTFISFAQNGSNKDAIPRHAVKVSPGHLFAFHPTIQAGYEYNIWNRYSIFGEGGYVINPNERDTRFLNRRGYRLKLEPRYYMPMNRGSSLFYYAAELYRNRIYYDRGLTVRECFDLECRHVYRRTQLFSVRYRENGIALKVGMTFFARNFLFDLNSGWAARFIDYRFPSENVQQAALDGIGMFAVPREESRTGFGPVLGARIGYRIR